MRRPHLLQRSLAKERPGHHPSLGLIRDEGSDGTWTMGLLTEIFSWWGGNTWGTRFTIWRQGKLVGQDEFGNRYYEQVRGFSPHGGPRRWVTYVRMSESTQVPPAWFGWLHHTVDTPPTQQAYTERPWQKPGRMNMTGTSQAYRPPGSILTPERRAPATGDYSAWKPD